MFNLLTIMYPESAAQMNNEINSLKNIIPVIIIGSIFIIAGFIITFYGATHSTSHSSTNANVVISGIGIIALSFILAATGIAYIRKPIRQAQNLRSAKVNQLANQLQLSQIVTPNVTQITTTGLTYKPHATNRTNNIFVKTTNLDNERDSGVNYPLRYQTSNGNMIYMKNKHGFVSPKSQTSIGLAENLSYVKTLTQQHPNVKYTLTITYTAKHNSMFKSTLRNANTNKRVADIKTAPFANTTHVTKY